jgi:hypothetical protein
MIFNLAHFSSLIGATHCGIVNDFVLRMGVDTKNVPLAKGHGNSATKIFETRDT